MKNTLQIIHSTLDLSNMINEEQDKFDIASNPNKEDLKLLVDFNQIEAEFNGKQMEIGSIKYKGNKVNKGLKKEVIKLCVLFAMHFNNKFSDRNKKIRL